MKMSALFLLLPALLAPTLGPAADAQAGNPAASGAEPPPSRLALGVGYPDVRVRYSLAQRWNVEAKAAFADSLQIYSGRLSWNLADLGPLKVLAGGEGGWAKFDGVDSISGNGSYAQAYAGLEYPFAGRLRVSVDLGPAWIQAAADGANYSTTVLVYNTALYLYIW